MKPNSVSSLSLARAAGQRGATGGQPAERQEACGGTHTLPAQRQLHVLPPAATRPIGRAHLNTASSTDASSPAHIGLTQRPNR